MQSTPVARYNSSIDFQEDFDSAWNHIGAALAILGKPEMQKWFRDTDNNAFAENPCAVAIATTLRELLVGADTAMDDMQTELERAS